MQSFPWCNLSCESIIDIGARLYNLQRNFDFCAIHVIFDAWRSVEIVVELGIFVMFLIFSWKKIRSKIIQITLIEFWSLISFELRHLNSMKMSQKAKFGCSIFQLKVKRKQLFQVQHQFGHFIKCRIWHESHKRYMSENVTMHGLFENARNFLAYSNSKSKKAVHRHCELGEKEVLASWQFLDPRGTPWVFLDPSQDPPGLCSCWGDNFCLGELFYYCIGN